jgi:hypothetical protein
MSEKDDEIIALLRELVSLSKENAARYADAVKRSQRSNFISRTFSVLILGLLVFYAFVHFGASH